MVKDDGAKERKNSGQGYVNVNELDKQVNSVKVRTGGESGKVRKYGCMRESP